MFCLHKIYFQRLGNGAKTLKSFFMSVARFHGISQRSNMHSVPEKWSPSVRGDMHSNECSEYIRS